MQYEVIVVGLGAVGSAALFQLAHRGVAVLGIDRYAPPHAMGSSHGETRITRLAVGEGDQYVPLVRRSHEIWRDLEAELGTPLLNQTGALIIGSRAAKTVHHGKANFLNRTIAAAERFGIAHEILDAKAVAARFPQFALSGDEIAYFEPEAGMLAPERCVEANIRAARNRGAAVQVNERVLDIRQDSGGVAVETTAGVHRAKRCIVAAGAWIGGLLGGEIRDVTPVYRQALHWFAPDHDATFAPSRCPVFIWMHGADQADYMYGFPEPSPGAGVKIATEQVEVRMDPDGARIEVTPVESEALFARHVAGRLRGVTPRRLRAQACLYTVTPDSGFIVGDTPGMDRVLAVSACSGHGFKHAAALGEALAERIVDGDSKIALDAFAPARFATV